MPQTWPERVPGEQSHLQLGRSGLTPGPFLSCPGALGWQVSHWLSPGPHRASSESSQRERTSAHRVGTSASKLRVLRRRKGAWRHL